MYIKGNGTLAASVTTSGTAPDQTTAVASSTAAATPTGPVTVQTAGSFISIGCYNDTVGSRAFSVEPAAGNTMTIELCAAACASYAYFGVEYGVECYCGNQIASGSVNMATGCSMACGGNSSELCGGPNRLNAYQNSNIAVMSSTVSGSSVPTTTVSSSTSSSAATTRAPVQGSQYAGCWTDSTGLRVLTGGGTVGNAASPMSLEVCGAYCSGFVYWGVEYGQE
ncbi:WSC domain-containing protein [Cryomyces antarcticus]